MSRTDTLSQNRQERMDGIKASLGTLLRYSLAKDTQLSGPVTPVHKIKVREHFLPPPPPCMQFQIHQNKIETKDVRYLEHSTSV